MTRLVNHVRKVPYKVEKDGVTVFICGCGLSTNPPYCTGSHKKAQDEPDNGVFVYDLDLNRVEFSGPNNNRRYE